MTHFHNTVIKANQFPGPAIVHAFARLPGDWYSLPKSGEPIDLARGEARRARRFSQEGQPSPALLVARIERLENFAGIL